MIRRKENGFTLIEVLLIVMILGLLAAIAYASIFPTRAEGFKVQCRNNRVAINSKIDLYYFEHGEWPDNTNFEEDILGNNEFFPDGKPVCQKGGTYSINESTHRCQCSDPEHND